MYLFNMDRTFMEKINNNSVYLFDSENFYKICNFADNDTELNKYDKETMFFRRNVIKENNIEKFTKNKRYYALYLFDGTFKLTSETFFTDCFTSIIYYYNFESSNQYIEYVSLNVLYKHTYFEYQEDNKMAYIERNIFSKNNNNILEKVILINFDKDMNKKGEIYNEFNDKNEQDGKRIFPLKTDHEYKDEQIHVCIYDNTLVKNVLKEVQHLYVFNKKDKRIINSAEIKFNDDIPYGKFRWYGGSRKTNGSMINNININSVEREQNDIIEKVKLIKFDKIKKEIEKNVTTYHSYPNRICSSYQTVNCYDCDDKNKTVYTKGDIYEYYQSGYKEKFIRLNPDNKLFTTDNFDFLEEFIDGGFKFRQTEVIKGEKIIKTFYNYTNNLCSLKENNKLKIFYNSPDKILLSEYVFGNYDDIVLSRDVYDISGNKISELPLKFTSVKDLYNEFCVPTYDYSGNKICSLSKTIIYSGQYNDNKQYHGYGTLYNTNSNIRYKGQFENGIINGKGTFYYQNGNIKYDGDIKNGKFDGYGIFYYPNGQIAYKGNYLRGFENGKGIKFYMNKELKTKKYFEGIFRSGEKFEGILYKNCLKQKVVIKDGKQVEFITKKTKKEFISVNNLKCDEIKEYRKVGKEFKLISHYKPTSDLDGIHYEYFKNGKIKKKSFLFDFQYKGDCETYHPDGRLISKLYINDTIDSKGEIYYPKKSSYSGTFFCGFRQGNGSGYYKGTYYENYLWYNNKPFCKNVDINLLNNPQKSHLICNLYKKDRKLFSKDEVRPTEKSLFSIYVNYNIFHNYNYEIKHKDCIKLRRSLSVGNIEKIYTKSIKKSKSISLNLNEFRTIRRPMHRSTPYGFSENRQIFEYNYLIQKPESLRTLGERMRIREYFETYRKYIRPSPDGPSLIIPPQFRTHIPYPLRSLQTRPNPFIKPNQNHPVALNRFVGRNYAFLEPIEEEKKPKGIIKNVISYVRSFF